MVKAYERLPVPPTITVDLETCLAIEVEEDAAPEIDYSSVKQYLDLPKEAAKQKEALGDEGDSVLMLDFSCVKELAPLALPKVTTTYVTTNKTAVANHWHFMLLQFPNLSSSLGMLLFLPGTELWYFIDVAIPGGHTSPTLSASDSFSFPLDLIAWQLFDFFAHRIVNEEPYFQERFAPFSLSCPDETLAILLSSLFLDLGLPAEKRITTSMHEEIPMRYRECMAYLPNRRPEWMPLGDFKTVLVCPCCLRFSAHIDKSLGACRFCAQSLVDQMVSNKIACQQADVHGKEASIEKSSKGASFIMRGKPKFAVNYLPRLLYFTKEQNTELQLVEKRKQASGVCKRVKDLRIAKKLRKVQVFPLEFPISSTPFGVGERLSSRQDILEYRDLIKWDHAGLVGSG